MQWSRLKHQLDQLRAPALQERLAIHQARYRGTRNHHGRVWFTFDGVQIADLSDLRTRLRFYELENEFHKINHAGTRMGDFRKPNPEWRAGWDESRDQARAILSAAGEFSGKAFTAAAEVFLNLSIDEAMASSNPLIRALAVIDRRVGKRRLAQWLRASAIENPLVRRLLEIRGAAERLPTASGLRSPSPTGCSPA